MGLRVKGDLEELPLALDLGEPSEAADFGPAVPADTYVERDGMVDVAVRELGARVLSVQLVLPDPD
jgi:hypothetical protein